MTKPNKLAPNIMIGLAAIGVIGFAWVSNNSRIQTESIANLPAVVARLDGLEERLDKEVESINLQINRRELENRAERDRLLENIKENLEVIRLDIIKIEDEVYAR